MREAWACGMRQDRERRYFVPPSCVSARFAWESAGEARDWPLYIHVCAVCHSTAGSARFG